jgi:hypothetical protein
MTDPSVAVVDMRPGSPVAVRAGCKCHVMDNAHGRGIGGDGERYGWVMSSSCELHGSFALVASDSSEPIADKT